MKCINCDNEVDKFFSESFVCPGCGDSVVVDYYHCGKCNNMWKAQDDQPVFGFDLENMPIPENILDMFDKIEEELLKMEESDTMSTFIHKCIQCNSICYETESGRFECPECGFEWEVISCE